MAQITPTPRAGTWVEIDWALAPFPTPRAGTWIEVEGSFSSSPRAGTWLRIVGQPGSGTVRAGTWIRVDSFTVLRSGWRIGSSRIGADNPGF